MKKLAALCALAALPVASAQTHVTLSQQSPPLRQPVQLVLEVYNPGKTPATLSRIRKDFVTCPPFKLYAKAGGPPRIERYSTADCDGGETVTIAPGQRRRYRVQLPWRDLVPGAYTAFLEIPVNGKQQSIRADVNIGPGPFVTELVLPNGAKAGQPLDLRVAYRNVWRTTVGRGFDLCGAGLLIRDERGRTVYDSKPEGTGCTTEGRPITLVPPGGTHLEAWGGLPKLRAGRYTALAWGGELQASKAFEVKK